MLKIAPGQTDVWGCFYPEIRDEALLNRYRALSSEAERKKERCFRFVDDQRCYIVTRALIRTVLSRYAAIGPAQWSFKSNAYGKPMISNPYQAEHRIAFNLSHTEGMILLGIATGSSIGVDTENVRRGQALIDIADNFFSETEISTMRRLPIERQPQRFFEYWTLKEAYVKALGAGLSAPLDQFTFDFPTDTEINFSPIPSLKDHSSHWNFQQFLPSSEHIAAICTKHEGEMPRATDTQIMMRTVVPLIKDEIVACPIVRQSVVRG